jgi:dihydrolipoamide dehydrogenase
MAKHTYDLLVIGAGAAGSSAATTIHQNGIRSALVERNLLGGTCLNYGSYASSLMRDVIV